MLGKKDFSSGFKVLSGRSRRSVDLTKLLSQDKAVVSPPAPILDDIDIPMDYDNTDQYGTTLNTTQDTRLMPLVNGKMNQTCSS